MITTSIQPESIQKIKSLIWSNVPENDLLALEFIKSFDLIDLFEPELVVVLKTTEDELVKERYQAYLQEQLNLVKYISIIESQFSRHRPQEIIGLEGIVNIDKILYTYFKRTTSGIDTYLKYSKNEASSYRQEIFEHYLLHIKTSKPSYYGRLKLQDLLPHELEVIFQDDVITAQRWYNVIIQDCIFETLPDGLCTLPYLNNLQIHGKDLIDFPKEVFQLSNLKRITLERLSLKPLPTDWSSLKKLEYISFGNSNLHLTDLSFVNTLPKLKKLFLGHKSTLETPYLLLNKKTLPIKHWAGYKHFTKFPLEKLLSFASAIQRSSLKETDKRHFLDLVLPCSSFKELPDFDLKTLLKGLCINYAPFREACFKQLELVIDRQNGVKILTKGSTVYILGNTNLNKTYIRKKLKELSIDYTPTYSTKVTHLLIGKNPKGSILKEYEKLAILTENHLQQFFSEKQPQYLEKKEKPDQTSLHQNIAALLASPDATNAQLALDMLKSGGTPTELLEQVLVTAKAYPDSNVRASAKKLLELYAPSEWQPLIRDRQIFVLTDTKIKEQDINNRLKKIAQKTSVTLAAKLSLGLFKFYRRGLRYIIYTFRQPHEWRTKAFEAAMEGTDFDYATILGFKNLKDRKPDLVQLWKVPSAPLFPVDVIEVIDKIESINFHNCKLEKIPSEIEKFKDLKQVDFSCNLINKIPKSIAKLELLETLDLSCNQLKEFPMEVLFLNKLKRLDLRHMRNGNHQKMILTIPKVVQDELPECEILV